MQKLKYVPPGVDPEDNEHCVTLTAEEPFILSELSGTGGVEADIISSEIAGMDGELYLGSRTPSRPIKCTVWVKGKHRSDMYKERMRLSGLLCTGNKNPGTLYYENEHISVMIKAVPKIPGDFTSRVKNYSRAYVEFRCPDPKWQSTEISEANIAAIEGIGFSLPSELNSVTFANMVNELDINNSGTASTPVLIAIAGPSATPAITNETVGKTIRLVRSLSEGELLLINTKRGEKSVKLYSGDTESDAFGFLDPLSQFWELEPGVNHIVYGEGGQAATSIHISFYERYEGV